MSRAFYRSFVLLFGAALLLGTEALATDNLTTMQNPSGGSIVFGALQGQLTPQAAMGEILHRVSVYCGDRPQLGKLVQDPGGNILEAFFTVTGKNQDGKPLAGLVIVSAPKNDIARAAVLSDYAERFPSTANSMFNLLKQQVVGAQASPNAQNAPPRGSAPAKAQSSPSATPAAPPQSLQITKFPDGSGVISLPAGWSVVRAQVGDVTAKGPQGETLRFGMTVVAIDPTNPQAKALMGNNRGAALVAIRFGTDPASAFKSAVAQLAQKNGKAAPVINIAKVQDIPMQGGKNTFMFGDIDMHDGHGAQSIVLQMITTQPQKMGVWQMTLFQVMGPKKVMMMERATIAEIFPSYSRDSKYVQKHTDDSDRLSAGLSDFLRSQLVPLDKDNGNHIRTSDQLSDALLLANPNRLKVVPTSQYPKGIDY